MASPDRKSVAVIGAGIAGAAAAAHLTGSSDVVVFEKSRGYGGRMAARRHSLWQFDHGAQFFTARSEQFRQLIAQYQKQQLVSEWKAKIITLCPGKKPFSRLWFEPHYVATPAMSALAKALTNAIDVKLNTQIDTIYRTGNRWSLQGTDGKDLGAFDQVVSAIPAPQSLAILPESFSGRDKLLTVSYSPCFALMLGYQHALRISFDAAVVRESPLAWIRATSIQAGPGGGTSLVIHSSNQWAAEKLEHPPESIQNEMLDSLAQLLGGNAGKPDFLQLHKWRYARVEESLKSGALVDHEQGLAACGDWCLGNRVEDAYLSGSRAASLFAE